MRQNITKAAEKAYAYIRLLSSLIPASPTSRLLPSPILVQRRQPDDAGKKKPRRLGATGAPRCWKRCRWFRGQQLKS